MSKRIAAARIEHPVEKSCCKLQTENLKENAPYKVKTGY
jgi:hypothetical protein